MSTSEPGARHVYGPVPSRRLGRSLGVDIIPYKVCSYDCVYCQLGRTTCKTVERREWVSLDDVKGELERALSAKVAPDFVTLSGSGEPTLHSGLGELVQWIKARTQTPVAVLTNGSLLWLPEVRDALAEADLVVPSLDAADVASFRYANRPHPAIGFDLMVGGLVDFARSFRGRLWLEVLLLEGVTGIAEEVAAIARIAHWIAPERIHLGTVTRPPAEPFAQPVPIAALRRFRSLFDPKAEVIADRPRIDPKSATTVGDEEVLELLKRRPCTLHDLACGLGAPENEVVKTLDRLKLEGAVRHDRRSGGPFYRAVRDVEVRA
jgi:wyosine [tRNA(Phe)-imidazoG37] synthetase (radical SAM superfamily)